MILVLLSLLPYVMGDIIMEDHSHAEILQMEKSQSLWVIMGTWFIYMYWKSM